MHTVFPYENDHSIRILYDEPYIRASLPAAVEMAGALVFFNNEPFPDSDGAITSLEAPEATALTLTSVGKITGDIVSDLDRQFGYGSAPLESMYRKLGASGQRAGVLAVAAAFEQEVYQPERKPDLSPVRPGYQEHFFDLTAELATGKSIKEIGASLFLSPATVAARQAGIAEDLDLKYLMRKGPALVMLAGAAESLPVQGKEYDATVFLSRVETSTREILYDPNHDQMAIFCFRDQRSDLMDPNFNEGYLKWISLRGAVINVNDVAFLDHAGNTVRLMPVEMAALMLRCVMSDKEVMALTGWNTRVRGRKERMRSPLRRAYDKLLPPVSGQRGLYRPRALERAIGSAFSSGLLIAQNPPDEQDLLNQPWRDRAFPIGSGLAAGKTISEIAAELAIKPGTVNLTLTEIRRGLDVTNGELALISEADRYYRMAQDQL